MKVGAPGRKETTTINIVESNLKSKIKTADKLKSEENEKSNTLYRENIQEKTNREAYIPKSRVVEAISKEIETEKAERIEKAKERAIKPQKSKGPKEVKPVKKRVSEVSKVNKTKYENVYGIEFSKPEVILLQDTGIGVPEVAARTCYDSFENSENEIVKAFGKNGKKTKTDLNKLNKIESSELLGDLAWTYFHHSILEHTNISYLIKGTSRGVLQEHARHRIQAISVRSTRYTMSGIINAFVASLTTPKGRDYFIEKIISFDMFVTSNPDYNEIEAGNMWDKLFYQYEIMGNDEFINIAVAKSSLEYLIPGDEPAIPDAVFKLLQNGKKKRNVGDAFKHIISDNVKVDMVITFNLRSLKNYFTLRDSGAAFFMIRWLAKAMKEVTPSKYLDLIVKAK